MKAKFATHQVIVPVGEVAAIKRGSVSTCIVRSRMKVAQGDHIRLTEEANGPSVTCVILVARCGLNVSSLDIHPKTCAQRWRNSRSIEGDLVRRDREDDEEERCLTVTDEELALIEEGRKTHYIRRRGAPFFYVVAGDYVAFHSESGRCRCRIVHVRTHHSVSALLNQVVHTGILPDTEYQAAFDWLDKFSQGKGLICLELQPQ